MERKVKYDYTFKLECVELVLQKHYSEGYVSKLKQIPRWNIRKWVSFYKTYGEIALLPRVSQNYSKEFKFKVLKVALVYCQISAVFPSTFNNGFLLPSVTS